MKWCQVGTHDNYDDVFDNVVIMMITVALLVKIVLGMGVVGGDVGRVYDEDDDDAGNDGGGCGGYYDDGGGEYDNDKNDGGVGHKAKNGEGNTCESQGWT